MFWALAITVDILNASNIVMTVILIVSLMRKHIRTTLPNEYVYSHTASASSACVQWTSIMVGDQKILALSKKNIQSRAK